MRRVILNADGERLGTVSDDPFDVTAAPGVDVDLEAAFEGVADATDADTAAPPVNADQLAAEAFDAESVARRRELIRSVARANDYALVNPAEAQRDRLARQYSEGDVVQSPQGLGVVTAVETEPFTGKNDEEIDASESSPTYVVGLKDQRVGVGFYSASELEETEMPDTGVEDPVGALESAQASATAELAETTFGIPDSWEESPKPNRLILLDAWSSMGGTFRGARKELGSKRLAASIKDRVLQWEGWRQ
jgi:hypothetical protein